MHSEADEEECAKEQLGDLYQKFSQPSSMNVPRTGKMLSLLFEGRNDEALALAIKGLRAGQNDKFFAEIIVRFFLAEKPRMPSARARRGRPKLGAPPFWFEIQVRRLELRKAGMKATEVRLQLAEEFERDVRSIDKALAFDASKNSGK